MFQDFDSIPEEINDKYDTIVGLLVNLEMVPRDLKDVRHQLYSIKNANELYIAVLQELLWLLKDQERRLKELETI